MRIRALAMLLLVMSPFGGTAHAQGNDYARVIVLRFAGPRADVAREAVMIGIAPYVELVDEQHAVVTAEEMGVDVSTPEGMAEVVVEMGISLVIAGAVDGRRGGTTIQVVNPQGDLLAAREAPNPSDDTNAIGDAAVSAVEEAQAELARRAAEAAAAEAQTTEPEQAAVPDGQTYYEEEEEEPDEPSEPLGGWQQPVLQMLAGMRLRAETIDALVDGEGPFFATDAYPEIDLMMALRPLAGENDLSRGLYLAAQGAFSVGIRYLGTFGDTRDMQSFRFRFDAGFGYSGDIFEIVGMLGVGVNGVSLDQSDGFQSYVLTYLRPGVLARIQAAEELFVIELGLGGRIGLAADELSTAYGGVGFGGVDFFFGAGGIVEGFTYAARFGYSYVGLGYGMGGAVLDASSGANEAIEGRVLLGYSIR